MQRPRKYSSLRWKGIGTRTTVRVPIPFLLTEEYFRGRSMRPHPAGPGLPVGRLNASGPRPCPTPFPSLFHGHHILGIVVPYRESSIVGRSVGDLAPRAQATGQVTALATCGTGNNVVPCMVDNFKDIGHLPNPCMG